ncbi:MAG: BREX system P-loop protein BrxC [Actinomycetaceae bacterium]|nr:BREX system P-loop protein BrxC [Actinomycetaceae bacterium]
MQIQKMFKRDITRYINGVISVGDEESIKQELDEYVVTRELQRHFSDFFEAYERGLLDPQRNTGVWIQGYFGSGKSHFLKMLSYILENKTVAGRPAVDYFDDKFEDSMTYARIRKAAEIETETILFNIDKKGGGYKEGDTAETAVLRSIARVFYEHLGFFGRDYKLARFEKMIDDRGKTLEFRDAYKDITGTSWVETRESYDFFAEDIAKAANAALGLSIRSITDWAENGKTFTVDFGELVDDIAEYARKREQESGGTFRLVFMVDEMGQYLNENISRMLNLQTLVEMFSEKGEGRLWMVVTSQEAIDEMMTVVSMDFSKIQGRFLTRLSLSSSSVDEVIKKRILEKTEDSAWLLEDQHNRNASVLKNLFSFEDSRGDLKGYESSNNFVESFPFVGYQFTIMPSVLREIRKHGYQGKSLSTGERSMLSSYQEAAQAVRERDEDALVPFWRFFDTLEKELDHGIKQVFERCRKAAENDDRIEMHDVDVLKVLYLINYINDIKPTVANIAVLMVDSVNVDMKSLKERVKDSLDRLVQQNYVARNGERYTFLTDEEQDVAREIRDVPVDIPIVVEEVKKILFGQIFTDRKFEKGHNSFPVDRFVDGSIHGAPQGGMTLDVITQANVELADASSSDLALKSIHKALLVLDTENDYFEILRNATQIQSYVRKQNISALGETKQRIIRGKQDEAARNRKEAEVLLAEAVVRGKVFVDGTERKVTAISAKQKIEEALREISSVIFSKAGLVDSPIEGERQLTEILRGDNIQFGIDDELGGGNIGAIKAMQQFLDARAITLQRTTMGDIQRDFQQAPFGWRELDIAAVVALLVTNQYARITRGEVKIDPTNPMMLDYLLKQSEVDRVVVEKRESLPAAVISATRKLLRDLVRRADIPTDEDGIVHFVRTYLTEQRDKYSSFIQERYRDEERYPGQSSVRMAIRLADSILDQGTDDAAFLAKFVANEEALVDNAEHLQEVEDFFESEQKTHFDKALRTVQKIMEERVYVQNRQSVLGAVDEIQQILESDHPYSRIRDLPRLVGVAEQGYGDLLKVKRADTQDKLHAVLRDVEAYAQEHRDRFNDEIRSLNADVKLYREGMLKELLDADTFSRLDTLSAQFDTWRDAQLRKIDVALEATAVSATAEGASGSDESAPKPKAKILDRKSVLPVRILRSEEEIDDYLSDLKAVLLEALENHDYINVR